MTVYDVVGSTLDGNGEYVPLYGNPREVRQLKNGIKLDMETYWGYKPSDLTDVQDAINQISNARGILGAQQNRLEHTISNVRTMEENITAAESRIRDTDMAKEIARMTRMNVLEQAAQSMLTQANQTPQQILQLLSA